MSTTCGNRDASARSRWSTLWSRTSSSDPKISSSTSSDSGLPDRSAIIWLTPSRPLPAPLGVTKPVQRQRHVALRRTHRTLGLVPHLLEPLHLLFGRKERGFVELESRELALDRGQRVDQRRAARRRFHQLGL